MGSDSRKENRSVRQEPKAEPQGIVYFPYQMFLDGKPVGSRLVPDALKVAIYESFTEILRGAPPGIVQKEKLDQISNEAEMIILCTEKGARFANKIFSKMALSKKGDGYEFVTKSL